MSMVVQWGNSGLPCLEQIKHLKTLPTAPVLYGRYRLIKPIAQGGLGKTFLAIDEADRFCSLCVVKQACPQAQSGVFSLQSKLLHQEALQLASLGKHPQIPTLLGVFEEEGQQYLVQELIDGENLEQVLTASGAFDEAAIWQLLKELLPILQFVHEHQMIHRDIKPANIIRRACDNQLVLVDFGAAMGVEMGASAANLFKSGHLVGSAEYTAPEQLRGKAVFASDLYSLGVTCIYLLTRISPFDLFNDRENTWVWQDYLARPVSLPLETLLNKLLSPATQQRYLSACEVLIDVKALTASIPRSKVWAIALTKHSSAPETSIDCCLRQRDFAFATFSAMQAFQPMQIELSATIYDPQTQHWYDFPSAQTESDLTQAVALFFGTRLWAAAATPPIRQRKTPSPMAERQTAIDQTNRVWAALTIFTVGAIACLMGTAILLDQNYPNPRPLSHSPAISQLESPNILDPIHA